MPAFYRVDPILRGIMVGMFNLPLLINLRSSPRLQRAQWVMHGLAMAAVWLADLPVSVQLPLSLAVLISGLRVRTTADPLVLRCKGDGFLEIQRADSWLPAEIGEGSVVLPLITVLRYRPEGKRRWLNRVILADCLPSEDYRRFRVWLKWRAKLAQQAGSARQSS